jgi:signal transduction histidine kinase
VTVPGTAPDFYQDLESHSSHCAHFQFARDLHDLLGSVLSALLLKCELAYRIVLTEPARAAAELAEVADIPRRAQSEMRAIATRTYRARLDDDISLARSALTAAGVELLVLGVDTVLPSAVEQAFTAVIRESTANLLCHGAATQCQLTIESSDSAASISVVNDYSVASPLAARRETLPAFRAATSSGPGRGLGLQSLALRVAELGGTFSSTRQADGGYAVRASVPVGGPGATPAATRGRSAGPAPEPDLVTAPDQRRRPTPAPWPGGIPGADDLEQKRWEFACRNLAYIARRCIPIARLCVTAPAQAEVELARLVEAAQRIVTDIREVTATATAAFRLDQESVSVREVLATAGIRSTVSIDADLPEAVHAVMATVMREGVIDVLRHQGVTNCRISLRRTDSGIRLDILNDGIYPSGQICFGTVAATTRVGRRLIAIGGSLTVRRRADGSIALHARV